MTKHSRAWDYNKNKISQDIFCRVRARITRACNVRSLQKSSARAILAQIKEILLRT
eukprot:UN19901